ncbi:TlpA family protein disulfide reductase [Pedobacter nanyangensis]|uniref:TlpA family protein disulfide reductase n=1 Tax=Pedobacter nanyangensis TaxID=1562389 RepID=UPI000DE44482|nr:TlpA disulfide reductase family protein [Pedobacter nanyangensis]
MKTKLKSYLLSIIVWLTAYPALAQFQVGYKVDKYPDVAWIKGQPLTKFDKDKIYLIEVWSTTCHNCIEEVPKLNQFYEKFKDQIVFISQSTYDFKEEIERYFKDDGTVNPYHQRFPIAYDVNGDFRRNWSKKFGYQWYLIRDNEVIWIGYGRHLTEEKLQGVIDRKFP